ncbi:unnamed protein product [Orchesella dallaii]|uniref:Lipoma-preferred partner n=2 Tax=Orchesella TaxID=48705 RepID=A0A1D2N7M1_ORCCI|nr:Lipoma-preferred partner [Orchesella cincta]
MATAESSPSRRKGALPPPPPPHNDFIPPASPVSSSYSELRRAIKSPQWHPEYYPNNHPDYQTYIYPSSNSQASSTVESLYEPIIPRSESQLSGGIRGSKNSLDIRRSETPDKVMTSSSKESEIDELTDLLMSSLKNNQVCFGTCSKCGEKVVGEGTGCTAMDQVFHIACFTCRVCDCLLQGKSFFYHVDGKPYCERCYMGRLEKCCVCSEPIVDRILRANGKPYHPKCFTCVVCAKSLEGIQFTIDAANRIYCIEDFHKKFAPRCSVCKLPIMPEPGKEETVRVVALDRSFHVNCYKCEDCGLLLRSEAEGRGCYPLDGHVLCKSCNAKRVREMKI